MMASSIKIPEPGVAGRRIITDSNGVVVATATTDADGEYAFTGLDAGDYHVQSSTIVDGKILVDKDVGDDRADSDADTGTGLTDTITLTIGEEKRDVDAGVENVALWQMMIWVKPVMTLL